MNLIDQIEIKLVQIAINQNRMNKDSAISILSTGYVVLLSKLTKFFSKNRPVKTVN